MRDIFSQDFFKGNRKALCKSVGVDGPVVVPANGLLQRGADASFSFQQDAGFWYLTGIDEPEVILVMDGEEEYLIVPPREVVREAFDGAIEHSILTSISGVASVFGQTEGWEKLRETLQRSKRFAMPEPNPAYIEFYGIYTNPARASLLRKIREISKDIELVDIRKDIARLRMVKQAPEITALQKAINITIESIEEAISGGKLPTYRYEYELEAAIGYGFRKRGARGHAFDPIVASGQNATTIHYLANNSLLHEDSLVIFDVGAEYARYSADISRTYSISDKPSKRQKAIFNAVADVQQYAYSLLKPGVLIREYEKQIESYMGKKLSQLKLITSLEKESIRRYYPHATSHFLGLDVHDAGDYDQPLVPGVVLTVEPGIYVPEENIGVRIEDDILITATGYEILSGALPVSLHANA